MFRSFNSLSACSQICFKPMNVPKPNTQTPAIRPSRCGINAIPDRPARDIANVLYISTDFICFKNQRIAICRTTVGAASATISVVVVFPVFADAYSTAIQKVRVGAVRQTPSIKKTIEKLGVVSRIRSRHFQISL